MFIIISLRRPNRGSHIQPTPSSKTSQVMPHNNSNSKPRLAAEVRRIQEQNKPLFLEGLKNTTEEI